MHNLDQFRMGVEWMQNSDPILALSFSRVKVLFFGTVAIATGLILKVLVDEYRDK